MAKTTNGKVIPFDFPINDPTVAAKFEALFTGLRKLNPDLTKEAEGDIMAHCILLKFQKNETLVGYRKICDHVYFMLTGLVTSLEREDGKDFNCWFMSEGDVVIAIESFFTQTRSREKLVALEDTECFAMYVEDLNMLRERHPTFQFVELLLTRHYYQEAFNRTKWIRKKGRERFMMLKKHYPQLIDRLTNTALASFLGMTRKNLYDITKPPRKK